MGSLFFFIFRLFAREKIPIQHPKQVLGLFTFFAVPFCLLAWLIPELATVLAALVMLGLAVIYLKGYQKKLNWKCWLPYAALALLLLLPKLFGPLHRWIGWDITWANLFGSGITASFKPLQSPLGPFLLVGLGVVLFTRGKSLYLKPTVTKTLSVLVVLFPSIAVAQLMIQSGVQQPSMVHYISDLLAQIGSLYPLLSPFLGIMGAFITGSTTISNVVFGPSQFSTAVSLQIPIPVVLALQLCGAALGNAICLFNIIAAAAIANLPNPKEVLARNLAPTLVGGLLFGILGWLAIYFFSVTPG